MVEETIYTKKADEVLAKLETTRDGLSTEEAQQRLLKYGRNELEEKEKIGPLKMFLKQFADPMVIILLFAIAISVATVILHGAHEEEGFVDSIVISLIVLVNAIFGFVQEYKSEKALEALKEMSSPVAKVKRNGKWLELESGAIVPGDIVTLEQGDIVPADGRIIDAKGLAADESALTGESLPIQKTASALDKAKPALGDMRNLVFQGSVIGSGKATVVVTSTGMNTEFGKIAILVQEADDELTPLQMNLEDLGKKLGVVILALSALVFFALVFVNTGVDWTEAFFVAVALAVAAIPEGLPAIVTVTLAIGVTRMVKRNAIVRKLPSVEALGSTTVICSDKTGTMTKNQMTVRYLALNNNSYSFTGTGYSKEGGIFVAPTPDSCVSLRKTIERYDLAEDDDAFRLLEIGQLCNNAVIQSNPENDNWEIVGDPTEGALLVAAEKVGLTYDKTLSQYESLTEFSFDSMRKRMTTVYRDGSGDLWAFTKGAPEIIIERSNRLLDSREELPFDEALKDKFRKKNQTMAACAMRVLALGYKKISENPGELDADEVEQDLVFVGLVGMIDPPREEVPEAIGKAKSAGIRTIMITGDHELTAQSIAKSVGLVDSSAEVINGARIESMTDTELDEVVKNVDIFARVAPEHKLRIVKSLKRQKQVVAMTGDGVNDAPAIRTADVGVSMGVRGADVTKEASDIVLTDDNYATIVSAVEVGREIFANIRKFVRFLLSANAGEVMLVFFMVMLGLPVPLTPVQILWLNLVTDGPPALALGVDPPEKGLMKQKARGLDNNLLDRGMILVIILGGIMASLAASVVYLGIYLMAFGGIPGVTVAAVDWAIAANHEVQVYAQTGAFVAMIVFQLLWVWNCRSESQPVWRTNIMNSKHLIGAVFLSVLLTLLVVYSPIAIFFETTPLSLEHLLLILLVTLPGLIVPAYKLLSRESSPSRTK